MPAHKHFSVPVGHAGLALESRVADLRLQLDFVPPLLLAERTGAHYLELGQGRGEFYCAFLGEPIVVTYPDFRIVNVAGDALPGVKQALLMYYFVTSDGTSPTMEWISFANLPEGRVYASAFQGYTGDHLANTFKLELGVFKLACESLNGKRLALGDASYRFPALPRFDLAVVYHLGDEDFPSTCNILFDETAPHYLPAEGCAILGNMLTQKILRQKTINETGA